MSVNAIRLQDGGERCDDKMGDRYKILIEIVLPLVETRDITRVKRIKHDKVIMVLKLK